MQVDSSLDAINRIAQTTTFQNQNLLDGSLDFQVSGGQNFSTDVQSLQVNQAQVGTDGSTVNINVASAATQAAITTTMAGGTAASAAVVRRRQSHRRHPGV